MGRVGDILTYFVLGCISVLSSLSLSSTANFNHRENPSMKLELPWTRSSEESPVSKRSEEMNLGSPTTSQFKVEEANRVRFRPYMSKEPWHTGPRAFLSLLFPRYGHYCGPNWSSGKDRGTLLWDKRPIDWLDYCCYCHDMGYDTNDQVKLLQADMEFLDCLHKPSVLKGDAHLAYSYKTMCIFGLTNILIPYRIQLLKIRENQPLLGFGWVGGLNTDFLNMLQNSIPFLRNKNS